MKFYHETPVICLAQLSEKLNKDIYFKMECYQPIGSFKIRGIGQLCQYYAEQGMTHFVASSGGNAGYAVAYAGKQLNKKVTVVVMESTPENARSSIRSLGADVVVGGKEWSEIDAYARKLCDQFNAAYIHPFDHPQIWQGHSTLIDEVRVQCEKPDLVVLSVGGGGLLCGVLEGLHRHNWQDVPVLAVETKGADSLAQSIKAQKRITLGKITSVAKTLGANTVAEKAFVWTQNHLVIPLTVNDKNAIEACWQFANDHRVLVELACGAALSAVYDSVAEIEKYKKILVVVCGGIGVTLEQLHQWHSIAS